jgi:nucleoid-associated protein YgaU
MATRVVVSGGNLFALAAQYLKDATQWIRIAQANGISDPQLTGTNTVIIPPVDPTAGGGIAN